MYAELCLIKEPRGVAMLGAASTLRQVGRKPRPWIAQRTESLSCASVTLSCDTLPHPAAPRPAPEKTWNSSPSRGNEPLDPACASIWSWESGKRPKREPFESGNEHLAKTQQEALCMRCSKALCDLRRRRDPFANGNSGICGKDTPPPGLGKTFCYSSGTL